MNAPPRWSIAPYFIVDDVVATANHYRDRLGFHYDRFWSDPPAFCMVKRQGVIIMLSQLERQGVIRPNRMVDPEGGAWDAYLWIDDADALFAEFKSRGRPSSAIPATRSMAAATSKSRIATGTGSASDRTSKTADACGPPGRCGIHADAAAKRRQP